MTNQQTQRNWLQRLLDRIPRLMWLIGHEWSDGVIEWGYIIPRYDAGLIADERDITDDECDGGYKVVVSRVWISPAKLEQRGEFQGW